MKLLDFQQSAIDTVINFTSAIDDVKKSFARLIGKIDPASFAWNEFSEKGYCSVKTANNSFIPNVAICVPTGGGKTIIGVSAIARLQTILNPALPLAVWLVPSEAIYSQVKREFKSGGRYFDYAKRALGFSINLKTIEDSWSDSDFIDGNLNVLLLTNQSLIRQDTRRNLQLYRNADKVSNLSIFADFNGTPSVYELLKIIKPVFIIDESHRIYTEIGRDFFRNDEIASFILELTATPKAYTPVDYPNIIYAATGKDLIDNCLIKTPLVYHALTGLDLKELLKVVVNRQFELQELLISSGYSVAPKVLISTEYTGEQFADEIYSVQNIAESLKSLGIESDRIAIKSSELDEIKDMDTHERCELRYEKLKSFNSEVMLPC